jgi:outer membrane protein assembly factor BamE
MTGRQQTRSRSARLVALFVCLSFAGACAGEHGRLMREKYPAYPEEIKRAIDRGYPVRGMDHDQVRLALGDPVCMKTITVEGRPVEVWLFPPGGRDPCVTPDYRVYFEEGVVTGWQDLRRAPPGSVPPVVKRGETSAVTPE